MVRLDNKIKLMKYLKLSDMTKNIDTEHSVINHKIVVKAEKKKTKKVKKSKTSKAKK